MRNEVGAGVSARWDAERENSSNEEEVSSSVDMFGTSSSSEEEGEGEGEVIAGAGVEILTRVARAETVSERGDGVQG